MSIDHLARWAKLSVLRLSCAEATEMTPDAVQKHDPARLTGDARVDRPFLVAKLEHLTMLNGGAVSSTERWDAELYYVHFVAALPGVVPDNWGRYAELVEKHGKGPRAAPKGSQTLKSKLLSESVRAVEFPRAKLTSRPDGDPAVGAVVRAARAAGDERRAAAEEDRRAAEARRRPRGPRAVDRVRAR